MMMLSDFDFALPAELIAQEPLAERTSSRLLVVCRRTGEVTHARFADLPQWLTPGDLLVRNETRVIPARLRGRKASGGQIELLYEPADHRRSPTGGVCRLSDRPGRAGA